MDGLPLGRNAIGNKCVFRVKSNPRCSVNRFKAWLVAQGFSQRPGVDYSNTFSPVVKLRTLRTVLALMAARGIHAHYAHTETTFLNAYLQEEIFLRQPKGAADGTLCVLRLIKSTYGLKEASRQWYSLFHTTLTSLSLKRSTSDSSLYSMNHPAHGICIVLLYVDDTLVSDSLDWVTTAKEHIRQQLNMTDFGHATSILGIDIARDLLARSFRLSEEQHTTELLEKYGRLDNNPSISPMSPTHYRDVDSASPSDKVPLSSAGRETFRAIFWLCQLLVHVYPP
jgi:hypothetical protein